MITVTVPKREVYVSDRDVFYHVDHETTIQLEHSLISIQKWESKWHKPFLSEKEKSVDEIMDYVRCMCVTPNVKEDVFYCMTQDQMKQITDYIDDPMTATWFSEDKDQSQKKKKKEVITAEIIYYWMIALNIPSEYKKWHINQLLTLIRVINIKNDTGDGKKKRSRREILENQKRLNDLNKQKFNTSG